MLTNFIKIGPANISIKLLNVDHNKNQIIKYIDYAKKLGLDIVHFQELTLTGVSAGELVVSQEILLKSSQAIQEILEHSKGSNMLIVIGGPLSYFSRILNCLFVIQDGEIKSIVPKSKLSPRESTYFSKFSNPTSAGQYIEPLNALISNTCIVKLRDKEAYINIVHEADFLTNIGSNPSNINLISGSENSIVEFYQSKSDRLKSLSSSMNTAISYAGPSSGESSTDGVYNSSKYIIENGNMISSTENFKDSIVYSDINLDEVKKPSTTFDSLLMENYFIIDLESSKEGISLTRKIGQSPYIPTDKDEYNKRMKQIIEIQAQSLIRRMKQIGTKDIFLGLSGGLDSTLAILSASYAFTKMDLDLNGIHAISMPGLGTSNRTKNNSKNLALGLGVDFKEIDITKSVLQHFEDIGHDKDDLSVTFENAQARERTQILMDLANKYDGLVLGTGNMSELALGFATYNGDHMSMYSINGGIPKTLLREVVRYYKDNMGEGLVKESLTDILNTPISPELLPPKDGEIAQKTEDNIGPYELHDFFIYHVIRNKSSFENVLLMAKNAFEEKYDIETIKKWLEVFLRRFSTQQFKRSCQADGPQILDFSFSPRGGLIMASDIDILRLNK